MKSARTPATRTPARRTSVETALAACVGVLCALSILMVFSASAVTAFQGDDATKWKTLVLHCLYMGVGLFGAYVASRIPLAVWRDKLGPIALLAAVVSLVIVRLPGMPWSEGVNGAVRWIRVGDFGFQPSELAKLALVLWLARLLTVRQDLVGTNELLKRSLVGFGSIALLVFLGDDLGTVILLGIVFVVMLWLGGAPSTQMGVLMAGLGVFAFAVVMAFDGFRLTRITAFLHPEDNLQGAGYQIYQSKVSFATGGLLGQGPGGANGKWGWLPEAHTDFILAVTGEELGVPGVLLTIGALAGVVVCAAIIGIKSRDRFGQLAAWGIATWLALQAGINISSTVGAMPTKGIPLPFMSYGGTSMMISLIAIGVLYAIAKSPTVSTATASRAKTSRSRTSRAKTQAPKRRSR